MRLKHPKDVQNDREDSAVAEQNCKKSTPREGFRDFTSLPNTRKRGCSTFHHLVKILVRKTRNRGQRGNVKSHKNTHECIYITYQLSSIKGDELLTEKKVSAVHQSKYGSRINPLIPIDIGTPKP